MKAPSHNPITLKFGSTAPPYTKGFPHMGTDYSYLPDDKIYAPADGRVILVPNNGKDGNGVYMNIGNYFVGMLHTSKYLVKNGATVKAGQAIAVMGDTGFAQGKHLHFCVKLGNAFIDPTKVIEEEDMYKGHDAKYWYDKYVAASASAAKATRIAEARATLLNKIRSLFGK